MFCSSESCDSAICLSSEPCSRPLVMEAFYCLYSTSPLFTRVRGKINSRKFAVASGPPPYPHPGARPVRETPRTHAPARRAPAHETSYKRSCAARMAADGQSMAG
jgi:hypothetical protein